jgi:tRNA(fMet)-specific endonuclease VapC
MKVALDTNICIALMNRSSVPARRRLASYPPGHVVMSAVVLFELLHGAMKSARPGANLANVRDLRLLVRPVDFNEDDAAEASRVRRQLENAGTPIGPYDTLIAGHARARGLVLATNNIREFSRVPGLVVEDWLADP